jgi:hypothetical protein
MVFLFNKEKGEQKYNLYGLMVDEGTDETDDGSLAWVFHLHAR